MYDLFVYFCTKYKHDDIEVQRHIRMQVATRNEQQGNVAYDSSAVQSILHTVQVQHNTGPIAVVPSYPLDYSIRVACFFSSIFFPPASRFPVLHHIRLYMA